ncbi:hypothetical protein A3O17_01020 [Ligilactobacillus aviarius]|uniref:hypothetical protein n=1 Tax=Ligilactobacillus aviarius TaxID=1606 RepID=UPI0007DF32C2|nr:hypothetical protein [Ligilactobacillus aviarius]OAQ06370.1 hypothetical protein A3O15_03200 [Ligilactobacillus aviarius]OAS74809.1 hypothetical protein A3O17_01020 [Ligilactobacillus aviarius]
MKKIVFSCSVVLLGVALTGCGSQSHRTNIHTKIKSEKVSSSKKNSSSAKSSSSSMKSSSSLTSSVAQSAPATNANTQNQQQKQNNDVQPQAVQQTQQAVTPQQPVQQNQQYTEQGHYPTWKEGNVYCAQLPDGTVMKQTFADGDDPGTYQGNPEVQRETAQMQNQWNKEHGIN